MAQVRRGLVRSSPPAETRANVGLSGGFTCIMTVGIVQGKGSMPLGSPLVPPWYKSFYSASYSVMAIVPQLKLLHSRGYRAE
jgi:hypothetical protein